MSTRKYQKMAAKDRREDILRCALGVAKTSGYDRITRQCIADAAGCSEGLVSRYFGTMPQLRRALMRAAIQSGVHEVVAQGLAAKDKHAQKAPEELKQRAIAYLANA